MVTAQVYTGFDVDTYEQDVEAHLDVLAHQGMKC